MKRYMAAVAVVLSGILWGMMSLFVNYMAALGLSSLQIVAMRLLAATVILWVWFLLFGRRHIRVRLRDLPLLLLLGVCGMAATSTCYFNAILLTSASVAAVLMYTSPIFILVFSVILFRERLTGPKIVALVLAFLGCVLVSGLTGGANVSPLGIVLGLLSGVFYASYSIIGVFALHRYPSSTVTLYAFSFAALAVFLVADLPGTFVLLAGAPRIGEMLFMLFAMGFVTAVAPYALYTYGLSHMEAGRAGILACVEPLAATVVGVLVLHQQSTAVQWGGIACILVAVVLLQMVSGSRGKDPREEKGI